MYCQINAGGLYGLQSYVAQVEVDISKGLPCFGLTVIRNEITYQLLADGFRVHTKLPSDS